MQKPANLPLKKKALFISEGKGISTEAELMAPNLNYCNKNATGHDYLNKIISSTELAGNIFDRQIISDKFSPTPRKKSDGKLLEPCLHQSVAAQNKENSTLRN